MMKHLPPICSLLRPSRYGTGLCLITLLLAGLWHPGSIRAADRPGKVLTLKTREGLALAGYDPVAYFTEGRPVPGLPTFQVRHGGARYQFANAVHQALFEADPDKYAPAFGGYCGYAASVNRLSPVSPDWWQIVEGQLVLQHNRKAFDLFNEALADNYRKAVGNWPGLVEKNGTYGGHTLVQLDRHGVALGGYDPVSYFLEKAPAKGNPEIEATYDGALYHFTSQSHRETFEKDPARYAPAFGGYCGYAASLGKVRPGDPAYWSIENDRLILQNSRKAAALWAKDVTGHLARADRFWPQLVELKSGRDHPVDGLFSPSVLPEAR